MQSIVDFMQTLTILLLVQRICCREIVNIANTRYRKLLYIFNKRILSKIYLDFKIVDRSRYF